MNKILQAIEQSEKIEAAAPPGPWHIGHVNETDDRCADVEMLTGEVVAENALGSNFICHARNELGKFRDALKLAVEALEKMRDVESEDEPGVLSWEAGLSRTALADAAKIFEGEKDE